MINKHYFKCSDFLALWKGDENDSERLWRIKNVDANRAVRAERKSVLWMENMLQWHVKQDATHYQQLLKAFIMKNKSIVYENFSFKHYQLSLSEAHECQQIVNLTNWQMLALQKLFRKRKEILLFPNEQDRKMYKKQFWIESAQVHQVLLRITSTLVKRNQIPVKYCKVYHINEIECLGQLCASIFNNGRFYIQAPLSKHEWIYASGWDRSVEGLAQSGSLGITKNYHGKYNSVIQTLTEENVKEDESNYRELNNHWGKKTLTNQLLKFPCMIIVSVFKRDENNIIISKSVETCVMSLKTEYQQQANIDHVETLAAIPSPAVEHLQITAQHMTQALNANNNITITQQYWQNRMLMFNLNAFMAVQLPAGFNPTPDASNVNITLLELNQQSNELLTKAKSVQGRFQQVNDLIINDLNDSDNNSSISDNDNNINDNNMNDNVMNNNVDRRLYKRASKYKFDALHNNGNISSNSDSDNDMNANVNDCTVITNSKRNKSQKHSYNSGESSNDTSSVFDITQEQSWNSDGDRVLSESESESDTGEVRATLHILHPLHRWNFNSESRLNRMLESQWQWQRKHCKASTLQGDTLYHLSFENLSNHIWNVELPMCDSTEIADTLTTDILFDQIHGVQYIYLPDAWIHEFDVDDLPMDRMFGITIQDSLCGLLQLHIINKKHPQTDHLGNTNGRKCLIYQRCKFTDLLDLSNSTWDGNDDTKYKNINNNVNILDDIGSTSVTYDNTDEHEFHWWRVDLKMFMQFDNSARNMVAGCSKATSSSPCPICEATGKQIYAFPTPQTMCFKTRNQLQTLVRSLNLAEKQTHYKGCKEAPIWDCPAHRYGPTTLHDFEGIFALVLDCFKGYINEYTDSAAELADLQEHNQNIHEVYNEMCKLQDAQEFLMEQTTKTETMQQKIDDLKEQILEIQEQYNQLEEKWDQELSDSNSNALRQYLQILKKYKINEYYCMKGSVQGIMCARICTARQEFVTLAKRINVTAGILWQLLFENLNFVYLMLKRKYHVKFTKFELATCKHSYIDLYHQLVLVVRSWRRVGDLTIKPHYLGHDLEYTLGSMMSTAFVDEERIENCNQHVKGTKRLYHSGCGNQHGCREMLVGRRMNDRVLSCGSKMYS